MGALYKWTEEQDQFLRDNYMDYGARKCAEHLKRSPPTIRKRVKQLKISTLKWEKLWTLEQQLILKENYETLGPKACAELLGKPKSSVLRQASRYGLKAPNRPKYSYMAIEWLNSFNNPNIKHAENGGEHIIGPYSVDGYDPTTNTVYEFHGDRFHGNLDVFNPNDLCNPFDRRYTADQLWQNTYDRMEYLSTKANVIYIWENDYINGKGHEKF